MTMKRRVQRKGRQEGFALLLIFMLAATIALYLYIQMPRYAFEAQRMKEQLLMARGHEYQRAIQLYYRKFKRYPSKIEDLENTNDIRFLRHRYKDPLTGKDEWRLIHMGPAGFLADSLVEKPPTQAKDGLGGTSSPTGPNSNSQQSQTQTQDPPQVSNALVRRPGDTSAANIGTPGAVKPVDPNQPFDPNAPNAFNPNQPYNPANPNQPYNPVAYNPNQPYNPNNPNQPYNPANPNQTYNPGQPYNPANPNQPYNPAQPFNPANPTQTYNPTNPSQQYPGAPVNSQTGGVVPQPLQQAFGQQPFGAGNTTGGPAQNPALGLINQILTTPRQPPSGSGIGGPGLSIQGGIAGVASKDEEVGIMRLNDRKKYNEWEFVYDVRKDKTMGAVGGLSTGTGLPQNPLGGSTTGSTNQSTSGIGSGFSIGNSGTGQTPTNPTPSVPVSQ